MDTTFIEESKEIHLDSLTDITNLWFFGDVHRETPSCDVQRWKWFLNKAAKDDPEKTYYMGLGDYHDFASTREKKMIKADGIHETTIAFLDQIVERENRAFALEIKQMRGRLLGLILGNHSWVYENGKNSTEDLAERMGAKYLGWLCHYTLKFRIGKSGKTQHVYIVACHGKAGGKRAGATINQVEDLKSIFPIADIYVMGHDHQRGAWPIDILIPSSGDGTIKQKRQMLCRSGSFKKAYTPGVKQYEVGRLLRPADLGALKLTIGFHRDKKDNRDRVITDIEAHI